MSALNGDNVVERSPAMPWYDGPALLELLEQVEVAYDHPNERPARFPVQWVIRPANGRGGRRLPRLRRPAGQRRAAQRRGGRRCCPSGERTRIAAIDTYDGELEEAMAPMSLTLRLEDELDISRGELICHPEEAPTVARELEADVCWMADAAAARRAGATSSSRPPAASRRSSTRSWTSWTCTRSSARSRRPSLS